jgi:collagenase-like PrtC family protease
MRKLSLGCDFSEEHVKTIISLHEESVGMQWPARINGVYGSPGEGNPFGSVRPSKRETKTFFHEFRRRASLLKEHGLEVNLAINSLHPHDKKSGITVNVFDSVACRSDFVDFVYNVTENNLVTNFIVSHPYIIDLLHSLIYTGKKPGIIISTIMNVHTLPQLAWIKKSWPMVKMVCPALEKNRDFEWLLRAGEILQLELLANEFCSIGGVTCEGLYRQACYLSQSLEITQWNPMLTRCIQERDKSFAAWLKAQFILPQWMSVYEAKAGVNRFKITGRTHEARFIREIGTAYLQERFDGPLLALWPQLQATLNKPEWDKEQKNAVGKFNVTCNEIEKCIEQFQLCNNDRCGFLCGYCDALAKELVKE